MENEQQMKDTTRPQYEFFGINWGYRADAIVINLYILGLRQT